MHYLCCMRNKEYRVSNMFKMGSRSYPLISASFAKTYCILLHFAIDFVIYYSLSISFKNRNHRTLFLFHCIFIVFPITTHCYFRPVFNTKNTSKNNMNFIIVGRPISYRDPTKKANRCSPLNEKIIASPARNYLLGAGAANCLSSTSITPRTALAEVLSNSDSSLFNFNSIICSIPFLPSLTGTPR